MPTHKLAGYRISKLLALAGICCLLWLSGCSPKPESNGAVPSAPPPKPAVISEPRLWPLGDQMLSTSAMAAEQLSAAIEQLMYAPDADSLLQAQQHWHTAVAEFEAFYPFTRLGLAAPQQLGELTRFQYNIAAWPIQPGYLDSYGEHAISGLVFDVGIPLSTSSLREQHGLTASEDVALGFYALQFLLFGEEGERGPTLFLPITELHDTHREQGYAAAEELPRNRRRTLMRLQSQLIANDIAQLRSWWEAKGPSSAAGYFNSLPLSAREQLIQQAAVLMLSEHLVAISDASQPDAMFGKNPLTQAQLLAVRIMNQLHGWQQVTALLTPESDQRTRLTQQAITALATIADLPSVAQGGQAPEVNWQDAVQSLSALARHLREEH